jgi:hypothetical protein
VATVPQRKGEDAVEPGERGLASSEYSSSSTSVSEKSAEMMAVRFQFGAQFRGSCRFRRH